MQQGNGQPLQRAGPGPPPGNQPPKPMMHSQAPVRPVASNSIPGQRPTMYSSKAEQGTGRDHVYKGTMQNPGSQNNGMIRPPGMMQRPGMQHSMMQPPVRSQQSAAGRPPPPMMQPPVRTQQSAAGRPPPPMMQPHAGTQQSAAGRPPPPMMQPPTGTQQSAAGGPPPMMQQPGLQYNAAGRPPPPMMQPPTGTQQGGAQIRPPPPMMQPPRMQQNAAGGPSPMMQQPGLQYNAAGRPPPMVQQPGLQYNAAMRPPPGVSQPSRPAAAPPTFGQRKAGPNGNPKSGEHEKSSSSRINPAQMPRPKEVQTKLAVFETRNYGTKSTSSSYSTYGGPDDSRKGNILSSSASIPPPSTSSRFIVHDFGNASPRFMRSTMYQLPQSHDLRKTSEMPMAIVCQPLAVCDPQDSNGGNVPVVDTSSTGPVRCAKCRGYINPFVRWLDGGRRFQCNLCNAHNETPAWYFCNLGPNGMRNDHFDRPELSLGSVEYIASGEYAVRKPTKMSCIFVIDASTDAVNSGTTHRVCEAIIDLLESQLEIAPAKIGIATFGRAIHYFYMRADFPQPHMIVVPDVDDPYAPMQTSLLLDVQTCREQIVSILKFIISLYSGSNVDGQLSHAQESCGTAAIHSAGKVLEGQGGKVIAFLTSISNYGEGTESHKNPSASSNSGQANGEKKGLKDMFWTQDDIFTKIGEEMAESQVCIDLFMLNRGGTSFLNLARLRSLPEQSGGSVTSYQDFDGSQPRNADAKRLADDIRHNLTREQGYEALMRIRASSGLQVEGYKGSFSVRTTTDIDLAGIDADKSIIAYIKHDDKLPESSEASFQCALLYTTSSGQRRIRVHTLSLPVTTILGNLFRSADLDATLHACVRAIGARLVDGQTQTAKEQITAVCVNILHSYRKFCATSSSSGQLILPEALKLMPLYVLAFYKLQALQVKCNIDERAWLIAKLSSVSIPDLIPILFPRMIALHDIQEDIEQMPQLLSCSSEAMNNDAVLLLMQHCDGYIWIGSGVSPNVLQRLFGETSIEVIKEKLERSVLGSFLDNNTCIAFKAINLMCNGRGVRLRLVPKGSMLETKFVAKLIEDRTANGLSYVEYLCHLHRQIQNKFM